MTRVPVRCLRREIFSATDIDPRPGVRHANGAAYRRLSAQVKTRHSGAELSAAPGVVTYWAKASIRRFADAVRATSGRISRIIASRATVDVGRPR